MFCYIRVVSWSMNVTTHKRDMNKFVDVVSSFGIDLVLDLESLATRFLPSSSDKRSFDTMTHLEKSRLAYTQHSTAFWFGEKPHTDSSKRVSLFSRSSRRLDYSYDCVVF